MRKQLDRRATIKNVAIGKMAVSDLAQRKRRSERVDYLLAGFDIDQIGYPVVSERDHRFYIIDGQHRVEALKRWLGEGWEVQQIPCSVYSGLTESDEAEMFLRLNDVLQVGAFEKFKTAVAAGRETESRIYVTVEAQGLHVAQGNAPGSISAVSALRKVYLRSNADTLGRALRIIRDAFGDAGLEGPVIDGMGHLCQRYNGQLDEEQAKERLGATRGGVKGLLNRAAELHLKTGNARPQCVAAAAVGIINSGRGGTKLPSWWKDEG